MATNEKTNALTELFAFKKSPVHRNIISPDGNALTAVSPFFVNRVMDTSLRDLKKGEPPPSQTTSGHECYVVFFEPKFTKKNDWSNTQTALIEDRGISGLHMAFVELVSSMDGHTPNTPNTQGKTFTGSAIVSPPSKVLRELLYPVHYRDFEQDGFFALSIAHIAREDFFRKINACAGKIPLTRPEELASNSKAYQGEFSLQKETAQQLRRIQTKAGIEAARRSAAEQLRQITEKAARLG